MRRYGARAMAVAALCCALLVQAAGGQYFGRLVYQKDSLYHRILVYRHGYLMTLQFGTHDPDVIQSQVSLRDLRTHVHEYSALAFCGLLYKPEPKRLLVVGLGGGVIPREMRHYLPELEVDVVEIDPEIPPVAERFFAFRRDEKLQVHVADGRVFIRRLRRREPVPKYDIVILDAFNSDYIPFHLMTREFLEEVKGVLAEDGVVVANVITTNRLSDAEFRTFLEVYGRCPAYVGARSANAMLVGLGPKAPALTPEAAAARAAELQAKHGFSFDMRTVAARLSPLARPEPTAQVLTDDQAPVNTLRWQEREAGFGQGG